MRIPALPAGPAAPLERMVRRLTVLQRPGQGPPLAYATAGRNAWLELDLAALEQNLAAIRAAIPAGVELVPVVKANAYGHGLPIVPALAAAGAERFAVVWVREGIALREAGVTRPIIILGHSFPEDAPEAVRHNLTLVCHSATLADALSRAAQAAGTVANVHIKVDTGLHRFGNDPEEAVALAEHLRQFPNLVVEGLMTHLANADEPDDSFSSEQLAIFEATANRLPWIPYRHAANSATAIRRPGACYQGVRCGLAIYGIEPPETGLPALRPVLSLKARIARVVDVPPGEGVSYGLRWRATVPSRVALIPAGYADGYRRANGANGYVLIDGQRCPIRGNVAMDQFLVDVTHIPAAHEGDEAVLLGTQGSETITADTIAAWTGTISWEVLAGLQARLPRIYHREGEVKTVVEGA